MTNLLHFEGCYTQLQRVKSEDNDVWLFGSPLRRHGLHLIDCNSTRLAESNTGYDTNSVEQLLTFICTITAVRNDSGPFKLSNITGSVGQLEKGIPAHTSAEVVEAAILSMLIPHINLQDRNVSICTPS